jgi:PAS domain S-box-containing protein
MGLIACFMLPLVYHLPVVMQSPTTWVLRPETMLRLISDHRCTLAWVPNFALQFLARRVRSEDDSRFELGCLRALVNCSEPVRAQSIDEFEASYARAGLPRGVVKTSYAMAENVFAVTQSAVENAPRRIWLSAKSLSERHVAVPQEENSTGSLCLVSSGSCLPGNQVRISAPDGSDAADGHVGEILIRSDSLFDGYFNRADLSAEALKENWYWSGDLGFSLEGELFVIGRKKDLIIVAGKNIYPQDIEEIASNHPAIHDGRAVAFALYNPDLGTDDIILVAEAESERDLQAAPEIERSLRNAIVGELDITPRAIYIKPPRWIVKSTAGKPARSTTREKLLMEQPELVDQNYEYLLDRVSDCVILRSIEGRISSWNVRSEQLYGWSKKEAVGRVSHELLATQFPEPLERIDARLVDTGGWEGSLVHSTRDGRRLVVESRWKLGRDSGRVAEINRLAA